MSEPVGTGARRSLAEDLRDLDAETARLLASVRRLDPGSLGAPSRCEGWTRGHVLSHLARNADALVRLTTAATTGVAVPMYASPEARDADIAAGAGRPLDEQLTDLESSAARLATALQTLTGLDEDGLARRVEARDGVMVRAGFLPTMRLREVVIHGVDLDADLDFAGADPGVVVVLLADAVRRLRNNPASPSLTIRTDEGDAWSIGDGVPTVSGTRAAMLGWLTRGLTGGVTGELPLLPHGG